MKRIFLVFFMFLLGAPIEAQIIVLDSTFGSSGRVSFDFQQLHSNARDLIYQANEKIVVAGYVNKYGNNDYALLRLNFDGSLDSTFGTRGETITNFPNDGDDRAQSLIQLPDSTLLLSGISKSNLFTKWGLSYYDQNGSNRFRVNYSSSPLNDTMYQALPQNDGKILIANWNHFGEFCLTRLQSDGVNIDPNFGISGNAKYGEGNNLERAYGAALQLDQKIIVFGSTQSDAAGEDFLAVRYHIDGNIDTSFASKGVFSTGSDMHEEHFVAGILTKEHDILLGGPAIGMNSQEFRIIKLDSTGHVDTNFGLLGIASGNIKVQEGGKKIVVLSNDKILVVGTKFNGANDDFALIRFNSNGSIDSTFGQNGILLTDFGGKDDRAFSVAYDSLTQSIVVVGESVTDTSAVFAIAKYSLDTQVGIKEFPSLIRGVKVYPNPSTSESQIYFYLKSPEYISIDIIDIQGRLVKQIASHQFFQAGNHTLDLFIKDLAPGTYNLQLRNKNTTLQTVRFIRTP